MLIELKNFRCHPYKKLEFKKGLNLLSGESGIGKSTVFEAIEWCFYGGKGAYPFGFDGKKKEFTQVKVWLQNKIITRTKPPDFLKVELEDKILEFGEAQKYIDSFFGSKKLWETSSYIKQDFKNYLLLATNQIKTEIIKEIVLEDDKSEDYLQKIEKHLSQADGKLQYIENSDPYVSKNDGVIMSLNYQEKDIEGWKKYSLKKKELEERLILVKKQKEVEDQILLYKDKFPEELNFQELEDWDLFLKNGGNFETFHLNEKYLSEDLKSLELKVYKFKENQEKCYKMKVLYDEDSVAQKIEELQLEKEFLYFHKVFTNFKKKEKCLNHTLEEKSNIDKKYRIIRKLLNLDQSIKYNTDDFKSLKKLIEMKSGDFLVCPECHCQLILKDNKLEVTKDTLKGKEKIISTLRYVNDYYIELKSKEKEYLELKSELESSELDVSQLESFKDTKKDLDALILNLQKIEFYPDLRKTYTEVVLAKSYHPKFKKISISK